MFVVTPQSAYVKRIGLTSVKHGHLRDDRGPGIVVSGWRKTRVGIFCRRRISFEEVEAGEQEKDDHKNSAKLDGAGSGS